MLSPGPVRCWDSSCYHSTCLLTYAGHWQDRAGGGGWAGYWGGRGGGGGEPASLCCCCASNQRNEDSFPRSPLSAGLPLSIKNIFDFITQQLQIAVY